MANAQALINEGLWRKDTEFRALPRMVQCTFLQVLSTKDLDTAGVLTLNLDVLAKGCDELTTDQLRADFAVLEAARFVFVDYETDEILVRSYVRRVSATSQKNNAWRSVPKNARLLVSPKLRHVLAGELRRLRWKEADDLADEIDPLPTPSQPPPNPLATRSGVDTPFEPGSDPHSPVQVLVQGSLNAFGSVGEEPPTCNTHPEDPEKPCRKCQRRREWEEAQVADELDERRRHRAAAFQAQLDCPHCDDGGWILGDDLKPIEPARKCQLHQEAANG